MLEKAATEYEQFLMCFFKSVLFKFKGKRVQPVFNASCRVPLLTPLPPTWLFWTTSTNQSELTTATPLQPGARPAASTARPATMAACAALVMTGRAGNLWLPVCLPVRNCELDETKSCLSHLFCFFLLLFQEWHCGLPRHRRAQFPWQHATSQPPALHSQQPPSDRQPLEAQQPARRIWGPTYARHPRNNGEQQSNCWEWRHQRLRGATSLTENYCKDAVDAF